MSKNNSFSDIINNENEKIIFKKNSNNDMDDKGIAVFEHIEAKVATNTDVKAKVNKRSSLSVIEEKKLEKRKKDEEIEVKKKPKRSASVITGRNYFESFIN